jgi:hypothetical protein
MRATMKMFLLVATTMAGFAGIHGCGTADAIFDCQAVCSRYAECYDANYDVDKCRSNCRTASANDPSVRNRADECHACIEDKSCVGAFSCTSSCATIVP